MTRGVAVEIVVDVGARRLVGNVQPLRQAERAEAVEDAEIHRLGHAPHVVVHRRQFDAENLHRRAGVDVLAAVERLDEHRVLAEMGQQAQFDLRVVHRHQAMPRRGSTKARRISRPSCERIGMFCRLGLLLLRRPVSAMVWLSDVCSRPVSGCRSWGRAST